MILIIPGCRGMVGRPPGGKKKEAKRSPGEARGGLKRAVGTPRAGQEGAGRSKMGAGESRKTHPVQPKRSQESTREQREGRERYEP